MRTNKLVWAGLAVLIFLAGVVVVNKGNQPEAPTNQVDAQAPRKVEVKTVEGDTVVETLAQVQARYDAQVEENRKLREQNVAIEQRLESLEVRTGTAKGDNRMDTVMTRLESLGGSLDTLSSQVKTTADQFGIAKTNGYAFTEEDLGWGSAGETSGYSTNAKNTDGRQNNQVSAFKKLAGYVSIPPLTSAMPEVTEPIKNAVTPSTLSKAIAVPPETVIPRYTIPARATLLDNVAMSALIGIVPVEGKLKDPFPVKIIVGDDNLATNGLSIPGLKGAVFEGVAAGNWNLSCISVALTAATFTFPDGRIQHLAGEKSDRGQRNEIAGLSPIGDLDVRNSIGYISDAQGTPCISGQRVTDAHKQFATLGVLGLASDYFDARSEAEVTRSVNADGDGVSSVTGDPMKYAGNKSIGNSLDAVTEFYVRRNRDTFDAIVAPPGRKVVIHITADLLIDYHSNARKLVYSAYSGDRHANRSLD